MEGHEGAHSIRSVIDGLEEDASKVRQVMVKLEDQGWLIRVTLDPIQFKLAGCRKVYTDKDGVNIRCTTRSFHAEHAANGYKEKK